MERSKVYAAIDSERLHQDRKWGTIADHPHEVGAWLTIMRTLLAKAEAEWSGKADDRPALGEIANCSRLAWRAANSTASRFGANGKNRPWSRCAGEQCTQVYKSQSKQSSINPSWETIG